jgi:hypothetical protein
MESRTSQGALGNDPALGRSGAFQGAPRRPFAPSEGVQFRGRRPEHAAGLFALFKERQFIERALTRAPLVRRL